MRSRNKVNKKNRYRFFYNALGGVVFGFLVILGSSAALAFTEPTSAPSINEPTSAESVGQIETFLGTPNSATTGTDTIFGYLRLIFTNMGGAPVAQTPNESDNAKIMDLLGTSATVADGKTVFNFLKSINDGVADFPSVANVRSIDTVSGVSGLIEDCLATNDTGQCYVATATKSALDTDLVTGNIRAGVNIFGVAGNSNVVNTSTGTAVAGNILSGAVAWVDGASVTGTMTNVGAQTITPSTTNQTI
ncbi:MAG: hypothetical protein PHZ25_02920, partial [Candidatus Pacebacteria bacterium]|nr:hypothetical protein [Candidatus Paceibacterota bacterium]